MTHSLALMMAPGLGTLVMQSWGSRVLWVVAFFMSLVSVILYWCLLDRKILLSSRDVKTLSEPAASR